MKKALLLIFSIFGLHGFNAQNNKINYTGRYAPVLKVEKLSQLNFLCELMPSFESHVRTDSKTYTKMIDLIQIQRGNKCPMLFPQDNYVHARADYENVIEYQSVEIMVKQAGKFISAFGNSHSLNAQQKAALLKADVGSDVVIKLKFKFKNWVNAYDGDHQLKEAEYTFAVIPAVEAMMPGGYTGISDYLNDKVVKSFPGKKNFDKIQLAAVFFLVNEKGEVQTPKLINSSGDKNIDQAILTAFKRMLAWRPAKNGQGTPIKEEFTITLGSGGC